MSLLYSTTQLSRPGCQVAQRRDTRRKAVVSQQIVQDRGMLVPFSRGEDQTRVESDGLSDAAAMAALYTARSKGHF